MKKYLQLFFLSYVLFSACRDYTYKTWRINTVDFEGFKG